MDLGVLAVLVIIAVTTAISVWRKLSFSIVVSVACVAVFAAMLIAAPDQPNGIINLLAFTPHDLVDPNFEYTVLTSMYTHASIFHLLFNILGLFFLGLVFEQRIGVRPFVLLYFVSGICGTLAFAALRWNDPLTAVVGASGAISGVLGGFARLYPREKMSMLLFFFPLPPLPMWVIVGIYVFIQLFFIGPSSGIAVEGHVGGLIAGVLVAPLVVKLSPRPKLERGVRRIPLAAFRKLAITPNLKSMLERIDKEEIPEVKKAWIERFLSEARCPYCGSRIGIGRGGAIMCQKGHLI